MIKVMIRRSKKRLTLKRERLTIRLLSAIGIPEISGTKNKVFCIQTEIGAMFSIKKAKGKK